jgi:ribonucleotide monophosphatase NagD (HAD superfamily)
LVLRLLFAKLYEQKPGCHDDIMEYFYSKKDSGVTSPSQVAIVGDRLLTDIMMANIMGSYGVWIRDGVIESGRHPNLVSRAGTFFYFQQTD